MPERESNLSYTARVDPYPSALSTRPTFLFLGIVTVLSFRLLDKNFCIKSLQVFKTLFLLFFPNWLYPSLKITVLKIFLSLKIWTFKWWFPVYSYVFCAVNKTPPFSLLPLPKSKRDFWGVLYIINQTKFVPFNHKGKKYSCFICR